MKLGFIGTGTITKAIVTGLIKSDYSFSSIYISQRNKKVSSGLANLHEKIKICEKNQEIINNSDIIFLAVLPEQAEAVLKPLHFHGTAQIVSLIATVSLERISQWTSQGAKISRAVPLPTVLDHHGITTVYPPAECVEELFKHLGRVVPLQSIEAFDALVVASATMGVYFDLLETIAQWLVAKGVDYNSSQIYMSDLFYGLAVTSKNAKGKSFATLRDEHSTPNGLNQQVCVEFQKKLGTAALLSAFESLEDRLIRMKSS